MSETTLMTPPEAPAPSSWAQQAQVERALGQTSRRRAKKPGNQSGLNTVNLAVVTSLLVMAALTHAPVFGEWVGYIAALGGVAVGMAVALLARFWKMGALNSILLLFAGYILFGGLLAVPQTTIGYVIPTLTTLQSLIVGLLTSWKDLLTVQPPAGIFTGPAIMPYLTAVVTSFIAVTLVTRARRILLSLVPVFVLLVTGILWGSQNAPWSMVIPPVMTLMTLVWVSRVLMSAARRESHGTVAFSASTKTGHVQRWIASVVMMAIGVGCAIVTHLFVTNADHRTVLRDYIEPPLNLQEYHSPVSLFRNWNTTDKDLKLMTVSGLAEGERLRLATLDYYDGTIFQLNTDQAQAGFRHVGRVFTDAPLNQGAELRSLNVTLGEYSGNWVPGIGHTRTLDFSGDHADVLADNLFYSDLHITGLTTTKLQSGDAYTLSNIAERSWSDEQLAGKAISQMAIPQDTNVPDAIAEKAAALTAQADPGLGQVRAIEQALNTQGFYSDGSDGLSLPGHRSDRLNKFVSQPRMIGDDDQYVPTMALMLRSLGIPSRVVMGFYQEQPSGGDVVFTGKDVHLWVEVPFEGAGWVAFNPTPPRDQVPQTEQPKPRPNPTPQVLQPPEPPEEPAEAPLDLVEDPDDEKDDTSSIWPMLVLIGQIVGGTFLVLSPWLLLLLLKARRRKRRRTKGRPDVRAAGAWDELIDRATDYGVKVSTDLTRRDQARHMEASLMGQEAPAPVAFHSYTDLRTPLEDFAVVLDRAVFSEDMPDEEMCHTVWKSSTHAIHSMKKRVPWYRRVRSLFSTKSLRSRRTPVRVRVQRFLSRFASESQSQQNTNRQPRRSRRKDHG